jgi:hypothetical protein
VTLPRSSVISPFTSKKFEQVFKKVLASHMLAHITGANRYRPLVYGTAALYRTTATRFTYERRTQLLSRANCRMFLGHSLTRSANRRNKPVLKEDFGGDLHCSRFRLPDWSAQLHSGFLDDRVTAPVPTS